MQPDITALQKELEVVKNNLTKSYKDQQSATKLLIRRDIELSRANEKLMELDSAKMEFISVAAHQLRTPLSAIKWILSMLINKEFSTAEENAEFLNKAAESCDRMIYLVNDLLSADHIDSGKEQFVFADVNPKSLIDQLLQDTAPLRIKRSISLDYKIDKDCTVVGDIEKLRALFQNLFENALKYTLQKGTVTVRIGQGVGDTHNMGHVMFKDSGIGIPKDQQINMFSKFFRGRNAMKVDTTGSGLGLYICKQIAERHGGKLWFESEENQGSTFHVLIPLSKNNQSAL